MSTGFSFGPFEVRPATRALLAHGKELQIGARAFDVLLSLIERHDRVVGVDELLDLAWPGLVVEENNLSVQISALRKLLGPGSIATVRGRGYRFTAALRAAPTATDADARAREPAPDAAPWVPLSIPRGAVVAVDLVGALRQPDVVSRTGHWARFVDEVRSHLLPAGAGCLLAHPADGLRLGFPKARDAARAALDMQRRIGRSNAGLAEDRTLHLRIGMSSADTSVADSDVFRDCLALAASLAGIAGSDEIIVSVELLLELIAGLDADFEDLGEVRLAHVEGPVRAYRLHASVAARSPSGPVGPRTNELRPSIAVLPFECLLGNDPNDMFGEALADDVVTHLSRSAELSVISALSSRRLKRCGISLSGMASCLDASFILTGTYRLTPEGVSLNVQFQDVRLGTVLRSMHYVTGVQEAFEPAEPLAIRIVAELGQAIFNHALELSTAGPLPALESYSLLFGAIGLMHRVSFREFARARTMLEYLAQRQGCEGVASAWLAKWHVLRVVQGWSADSAQDGRDALDQVRRSLDFNSHHALALSIGGLVHAYLGKDLQTAGQMYQQALDANPSEPLAWLFSATRHAYLGNGPRAEEAGNRALCLSPIDPLKYFFDSLAATAALANGSWERSLALSERSLRANRTHASTWRTLTYALVMVDRMDEARNAVQQLLKIEPGFTVARFRERFPGRDGPLAEPWARALKSAGLPT